MQIKITKQEKVEVGDIFKQNADRNNYNSSKAYTLTGFSGKQIKCRWYSSSVANFSLLGLHFHCINASRPLH